MRPYPNSNIYNPSGKIIIANKSNILKLIEEFSQKYKSYKNKRINLEEIFIKLKKEKN